MKFDEDKAVVEPVEIVSENNGDRENCLKLAPFVRFLARMVDYVMIALMWNFLFTARSQWWFSFPILAWIPIEAILLATWGTTPGKFLLKISIKSINGRKLDFGKALRRSFLVWFQGMSLGIKWLSLFSMLLSYWQLKYLGSTLWDREERVRVSNKMVPKANVLAAIILTFLGFMKLFW